MSDYQDRRGVAIMREKQRREDIKNYPTLMDLLRKQEQTFKEHFPLPHRTIRWI